MARRWTADEEKVKYDELFKLYVQKNKTIQEIGLLLGIAESSVYDRLLRLDIPVDRSRKKGFNNINRDTRIPPHSKDLAEFIGALLGDGHITSTQVMITLGEKDQLIPRIKELFKKLFNRVPKVVRDSNGYQTVYIGSTVVVRWLLQMGLAQNKVRSQVDIPKWIFSDRKYMRAALRGLIDTDGSVYKLRFGTQISLTNASLPLLKSAHRLLSELGFHPAITYRRIYLTRRSDLFKYYKEIGFRNYKHEKRFIDFFGRVA